MVADDMGRSSAVNLAVAGAHDRGIVTAASIMAAGGAFEEAVQLVRQRPRLSVGLHVSLCDGRAVLPHSHIPGLTDPEGFLVKNPAIAGVSYTSPSLLSQIEQEVEAQFRRLEEAGVHPSHVDGHHHLHVHPLIFEIVCRAASRRGVGWIRIPKEPLSIGVGLHPAFSKPGALCEWTLFKMLALCNMRTAGRYGMRTACSVCGLSLTGAMDEGRLLDIMDRMDAPLGEIFAHPDMSTAAGRRELEALTSAAVREKTDAGDIVLVGYRELSGRDLCLRPAWERR
ncbi:MAG TPA: ChbG/HpnK family deacetylase [Dissulfurispiraceae bacterium]